MYFAVCVSFFLLGSLCLTLALRWAIKRGGHKIEPINPETLIIYPPNASARLIPLGGARNFRDLGGYHTRDGRQVEWGKAFRSDQLCDLSDQDREHINGLGLRLMIDLRNPSEIKGQEAFIPSGCAYRQMRVYKREPLAEYWSVLLFRRHAISQAMADSYILLAETRAEVFGAILRLFANADNFPINYHCTSGKDRTGIVTALLLSLLGVPDETIIPDYSYSNRGFEHYYRKFVTRGRLDILGVPYEEFSAVFMVDPHWMENLLAHIRSHYGSVKDYLIQKAGLEEDTLTCIQENLLS
jgi:protein-tyrosine phosphatase